ncbi:MAG: DNA mismatch repair protein [Candidatus Omnitrophica bacterium CG11_big_fil_rev_8_21_14_0_20_63_9]|nr:MAG: DNA mismatch repair protein [Candidatus Omnitrophica bacterium CG11_big_fil_rev_8_21_14_0_20_63_9]
MGSNEPFTFEISLSVLDHLGRHLYRSFATVLGEAISNSWDADAGKVWIYLDPDKNGFWIKDDGSGMTADDFQNKFLKIGYSKRKGGKSHSKKGRPFIGRKGIGKLALLSCAERISVISKTKDSDYVGGTIDNPTLDEAITEDLTPQQYPLLDVDMAAFAKHTRGHRYGTIIRFEKLKDGVKRSFEFLSKIVALYFRFSLLDPSFEIFLNGEKITHEHLSSLAENTEFLWKIGDYKDPYVRALERAFAKEPKKHETKRIKLAGITGFIASVEKPSSLKIMTTEERVGIDLFVNGRLRERDILKHIPTARIAENYLYGQIHFDGLDDSEDRFTSSRENIVADDPKYQRFLERFRKALLKIVEDWDDWRRKHRKDGDPENESISKTERASAGLYNAVAKEYESTKITKKADKVDGWVDDLGGDATFNFESYAECFISENLVRKYIEDKRIPLTPEAQTEADTRKQNEAMNKSKGNISIDVRKTGNDLSYLSMDFLAHLVDAGDKTRRDARLIRDADEFKPMRDAVAHTALLTDAAKKKLVTVRENIKGRVKTLLLIGRKVGGQP